MRPEEIKPERLPFVKRFGFGDEKELRVVYTSAKRELSTKEVPIPMDAIRRVVLNPWLHEALAEPVTEMFQRMAGKHDITVIQSSLIDSPSWRRFADGYA